MIAKVRKKVNGAFQEHSLQLALLRIVLPSLSLDFVLEIREDISRMVSEIRMRSNLFFFL